MTTHFVNSRLPAERDGFTLRYAYEADNEPDFEHLGRVMDAPGEVGLESRPLDPERETEIRVGEFWTVFLPYTRADLGIDTRPGGYMAQQFKSYRRAGASAAEAYRKSREIAVKYPSGQSKAVREDEWRRRTREDAERLIRFWNGDARMGLVQVTAMVAGHKLGEAMMGGVEPVGDFLDSNDAADAILDFNLIADAIEDACATVQRINDALAKAKARRDDGARYWVDENPSGPRPFGLGTFAVVDEERGGIVAYFGTRGDANQYAANMDQGSK